MTATLTHPWLIWDLGKPHACLSFAPYRGGFVSAQQIAWREVRNADLPPDFDVISWLEGQVDERLDKADQAIAMLTSRDIRFHHFDTAVVGQTKAEALVTLGLSNAERIGHRRLARPEEYGTINIAARLNQCLSETAMIEALTIMAEARTAAVMEARYEVMVSGAPVIATGTGTDCLTLACVQGEDRHHAYAGLHTEIGHALGRVVYDAVRTACDTYLSEEATA